MILTESNLKEWKAELNKIAKPYFGEDFADCVSDEEYLKDYLDEDTQDVLRENINCEI
jgi:hypothetical protein